ATLAYPGIDPNTTKRKANQTVWIRPQRQYKDFQYPACLTVRLKHSKGYLQTQPQDRLIALSSAGEVRGMVSPYEMAEASLFFLPVWLKSMHEIIHFEYAPSLETQPFMIKQALAIEAYSTIGNIHSPLSLTVRQINLEPLIQIIQILAGLQPEMEETPFFDINENNRVDLSEVLYLMKHDAQITIDEPLK
ncbi:MAG: hypothetical protein HQK75_11660, partial [Candidatus Magnetomorum sp.]|nr:hypothetical protein [Candidatus Magnetomorum sp.]